MTPIAEDTALIRARLDQRHREHMEGWAIQCAEEADKAKARRDMKAWHEWSQAAAKVWEELA